MTFKVQYVEVAVSSTDTTKTIFAPASFTAVSSLTKAFILPADSFGLGAFGPSAYVDISSFTIEFVDTGTIAVKRLASGDAATVAFYIIEYTGVAGGPNEFINRGQIQFTVPDTLGSNIQSSGITGISSLSKCVPFLTARLGSAVWTYQYQKRVLGDIDLVNNGSANVFQVSRGIWAGDVIYIGQCVEFTGSNWIIQKKDVTAHTANTNKDTAITAVAGTNKAWVHAILNPSYGSSGAYALHYAWLSSTTNLRTRVKGSDGGAAMRVWIMENSALNVQLLEAINGTNDWTAGSSPQTQDLTITGVDQTRSFVRGYAGSDDTDTTYDRIESAWRFKFANNTTVRGTREQSIGGTEYAIQVVTLPAATGASITSVNADSVAGVLNNLATTRKIVGTGFEASQGTGTVKINGVSQPVTSWSDTEIQITVVRGANRYGAQTLTVTNNSGSVATYAITLLPQTGWTYLTLTAALAPYAKRLKTSGTDLSTGDQLAYGSISGSGSVLVYPNAAFRADVGVTSFQYEAHDGTNWGAVGTANTSALGGTRSGTAAIPTAALLAVQARKAAFGTATVSAALGITVNYLKTESAITVSAAGAITTAGKKAATGAATITASLDISIVTGQTLARVVSIPTATAISVTSFKNAKGTATVSAAAVVTAFGGPGTLSGRNTLVGLLDEMRLWSERRTQSNIEAFKDQELDPASANLYAYWQSNEGVGTTLIDATGNSRNAALIGGVGYVPNAGLVLQKDVSRHFTADDIKKGTLQLSRRGLRNYPTAVVVEYRDASNTNTWRMARQSAEHPGVAGGSVPRRLSRISLPGIHRAAQAKREAIERVNYFTSDLTGSFQCWDEALDLQPGSIIAVTHPIGLNKKLFRVVSLSGFKGRWTVNIAEYDPAIYSEEVIATPTFTDTTLGNPLNPPMPANLAAVEELFVYKDGGVGSRVRISWTASSYAFFSQFVVECYVDDVLVWNTATQGNEVITPPVEQLIANNQPVPYQVKVYTQSQFTRSDPSTAIVTVYGKLSPPGDVPSVSATLIGANTAQLSWFQAVDIDIWRYEVRRGLVGGTWDTATLVDKTDALTLAVPGLPVGTHRLFVKAIDSVRNYSTNATFADVTVSLPSSVAALNGFEIGGEVRLNWEPVGGFVTRYRVSYSQTDNSGEITLDRVSSTRFTTKEVPPGTWRFRVYSIDDAGQEATLAATRDIVVTYDANAFVAGDYNFSNPTVTNMISWKLRTSTKTYYVTNMRELFVASPSTFTTYQNESLANYHSDGVSAWVSETKDFGSVLSGTWVPTVEAQALKGSINVYLELSVDNVTFTPFTGTATGAYRYARIRIVANTLSSTIFVMSPVVNLKVNVISQTESGQSTSVAVGPTTVTLSKVFSAVKVLGATPINNGPLYAVIDNIVVGGLTPSTFDVYVFDVFGQQVAAPFKWNFEGV